MKKYLLEQSPTFVYFKTVVKDNVSFELYENVKNDCFCLAWKNPITQDVEKYNCFENPYVKIDQVISQLNAIVE